MRRTTTLLMVVLSILLLSRVSHAQAQCQDNDFDGHCSVASGGDDCEDLMAAYKQTSNLNCQEIQPPTFLPAPSLPQSSTTVNDHSWIYAGGKYHLFAHSVDHAALGYPGSIRHFTSGDLQSLQTAAHPIAISSTPDTWDQNDQWAPHVVYSDGTYYMFFVGVGPGVTGALSPHRYVIGLARSRDLQNWVKEPNPVYDCSAPWVERDDANSYSCRDPFVM